jgi:hypothetical protein
MPLKEGAKREYQREYMRRKRGSNTSGLTGSNKGLTDGSNITPPGSNKEVTLFDALKAKFDVRQGNFKPAGATSPDVPLYNPRVHRPGVLVRMRTGEVVTIPELDADGHNIPDY